MSISLEEQKKDRDYVPCSLARPQKIPNDCNRWHPVSSENMVSPSKIVLGFNSTNSDSRQIHKLSPVHCLHGA